MALEKIRTQRAELLQTLQLYGRPGLKDDFLKFEADQRVKRKEEKLERDKTQQKIMMYFLYGILVVIVLGGVVGLFYMALSLRGLR